MSIVTETTYTVTMGSADKAKAWKFTDKDITVVDGVKVVSLEPSNISLRNFIIQDQQLISQCSRDRLTVATMQGYRDLMSKRNIAQAELLLEDESSSAACTLFGPTAPPKAKKSKQQTATPQLVGVSFTVGGEEVTVKMVKPLLNREALQVEFDINNPVAITHVIQYIRELGFEKLTVYERNDDKSLPPGIWRRKDRKGADVYMVKGDSGYRRFGSIQEAIVASSGEQTCCHVPSPDCMPESSPNPEPSPVERGGDHDEEGNADDSEDDACKITF